jgi:lysophospholipase L1-like esterase
VKLKPGTRLLFIGDSVTDCGRARPVGTGSRVALGDGYVAEIDAFLALPPREPPIKVTNMGISGNTVRDLAGRWETDVLALKPDWLSVMIGINDVWRQFDGRDDAAIVPPDEFRRTYGQLIGRSRAQLQGLVLMSPYYVQSLRTDPMRRRMDDYTGIVSELAAQHEALFIDAQAAIDAALARSDYASIAADRVHPTPEGHRLLARAFVAGVA